MRIVLVLRQRKAIFLRTTQRCEHLRRIEKDKSEWSPRQWTRRRYIEKDNTESFAKQWTRRSYIEKDKNEWFPKQGTRRCYFVKDKPESFSKHWALRCYIEKDKSEPFRSPAQERSVRCYIEKGKTDLFPFWSVNFALLHRKRQDWSVVHRNNELCIVTLKNRRLECSAYHPRTSHSYIDIKTLSHANRELWPPKRKNGLYPNQTVHFQISRRYFIPTENCEHQKRKNSLYPNHRELCIVSLKKTSLNCSPYQ